MAYRVEMTEKAEADILVVLQWFRDQNASAAGTHWLSQLTSKIGALEVHPERCSRIPESDHVREDVREILFGRNRFRYRILFTVRGDAVFILRL